MEAPFPEKVKVDVVGDRMNIRMSEEAYQKHVKDAAKLGMDVQEYMQSLMDAQISRSHPQFEKPAAETRQQRRLREREARKREDRKGST